MEIYSNLTEILGSETVAYSIVTRYLHMTSFTDTIEVKVNQDRPSSFSEIDETILKALDDGPFSSLHDLARHTSLSKTIIHRHLTGSYGLTIRHLRWVPHRLSNAQEENRYDLSAQLLGLI
jgi:hypothetical protein